MTSIAFGSLQDAECLTTAKYTFIWVEVLKIGFLNWSCHGPDLRLKFLQVENVQASLDLF